jgi:hypothetical protein
MSALEKGKPFPNLFLNRPDGTSFELVDLRRREHALVLLLRHPDAAHLAFVSHFQDRAKLFEWLNLRLVAVFAKIDTVNTPWPAPGYPPCLHARPLPDGLDWDKAYVVSKNGTLLETYEEPEFLGVDAIERDLLYWEAGHCLP